MIHSVDSGHEHVPIISTPSNKMKCNKIKDQALRDVSHVFQARKTGTLSVALIIKQTTLFYHLSDRNSGS